MRKIRYAVAMSLDGYIAGPNGEADWIGIDPEVDFAAIWAQFDTLLMGRRTYEAASKRLGRGCVHRNHYHRILADNETARPPGCVCRLRVESRLGTSVANSERQRYLVIRR